MEEVYVKQSESNWSFFQYRAKQQSVCKFVLNACCTNRSQYFEVDTTVASIEGGGEAGACTLEIFCSHRILKNTFILNF